MKVRDSVKRIEEGMELRKERHSRLRGSFRSKRESQSESVSSCLIRFSMGWIGLQKSYPYPHETTRASSMKQEIVEEGAAREAA